MRKSQYFPFQCWVLNKGTSGTIFITSLVWRGPWLGIEPGTSHSLSQHSTTRLSRGRLYFLTYTYLLNLLFAIYNAGKIEFDLQHWKTTIIALVLSLIIILLLTATNSSCKNKCVYHKVRNYLVCFQVSKVHSIKLSCIFLP